MSTVRLHPRYSECTKRKNVRKVTRYLEERERALTHLEDAVSLAREMQRRSGSEALFAPFVTEFESTHQELAALDLNSLSSKEDLDAIARRMKCVAAFFDLMTRFLTLSGGGLPAVLEATAHQPSDRGGQRALAARQDSELAPL